MKRILGIVQQTGVSDGAIRQLERGLKAIYRDHTGTTERVVVLWMVVPEGYAYSERKPSRATIVLVEVDEDTDQDDREALMSKCSQYLLDNFDVSPLDSLITVANTSFVSAFFDAQRARVDPKQRWRINMKLYGAALLSKVSRGYLRFPVKLS